MSGAPEFEWRSGMVAVTVHGAVATLTLDRPAKLNALDRPFWSDLLAALDAIAAEGSVRAIVLRGAGPRAFSVGGDVASFAALGNDADRHTFQVEAMRAFAAVEQSPIPIVAAVHGFAMGGGCELTLACDIVLASRDAIFGMPEARFGLVPGYGSIRAPAVIGAQMAKLMIYAGERLDAEAALRCGLAQKICATDILFAEAARLAAAIAAAPPTAIAAGRRLIDRATDAALVAQSIDEIAALHATNASQNAVAAFLDRQH